MTIREVIAKQIEKRENGQQTPYDLALFAVNMTGIIVLACHSLLEADVGKVFQKGTEIGGQQRDPLDITDIIDVINGEDMLRNFILTGEITSFFEYFLDQNEPGIDEEDVDGSPLLWSDIHYIMQKWNECAAKASNK